MRRFEEDVRRTAVREAEERVLAFVRGRVGRAFVRDTRGEHVVYDFTARDRQGEHAGDVKVDWWLAREGRVHYEYRHVYRDGREKDGWSVNPALDMVFFVNPDTWEAHLIRMREWRLWVQDRLWHAQEMGRDCPREWINKPARNPLYDTYSYSIPLAELIADDLVLKSVVLPPASAGVGA